MPPANARYGHAAPSVAESGKADPAKMAVIGSCGRRTGRQVAGA